MGPVIDPDGPQRRDDRQGQTAHQPQQRVPTHRQSEAMREPGARLPAEGHANRLQGGDQPMGLAGIGGDELGHTLREDAAWAARISAHEFPHRELDAHRARAPREVRQVALVAAVHRGRGHSTARAARLHRRGRQLETHLG